MRNDILRRTTALAGGVCILGFLAAGPAAAADGTTGDVEVVNSETVQVYMTPDGDIDTKRVYEQLALTGKGSVDLTNPVAPSGVRNLDGFSGVEVKDGEQLVKTDVDGEEKLRSVSDFNGKLPLDIDVNYELDGRRVEPGDLVGKSGKLAVTFDVENVTGEMQSVEVPDGKGGTVSKTVEVPIPMVGSLTSVAPENFTNVASKQANLAGDGKGGTKLSFTMTLFPPVGSTSASFGYTADITDGVVPRVEVSALPINPLESPTFASAAESYQGGADTGAKLTDGAVTIDANLLKLRDGAAELLAGLIKLRDGSGELSDGLNDTAVPGSAKLAAGAEELSFGLLKLDDGAGKLSDGAGELSAGTGKLSAGAGELSSGAGRLADGSGAALSGSRKLSDGLRQISGGLGKLADGEEGLPKANAGIKKLKAGVDTLIKNVALSPDFNPSNPATIRTVLDGLTALKLGIGSQATDGTLLNGVAKIKGGLQVVAHGDGTQGNPGLDGIKSGLSGAKTQLDPKVANGGSLDQLAAALNNIANNNAACEGDPTCKGTLLNLAGQVDASKTDLVALSQGLGNAVAGLTGYVGAIDGPEGLIAGTDRLTAGLNTALTGVNKLIAGVGSPQQEGTLLNGLAQVQGGLDQLAEGVTAAVAGISKLNAGATDAYSGSQDLSGGLGQLDAGAGQLDAGAGKLADGTVKLDAGADKLSAGAGRLADGTVKASDGGSQVADGAGQLADGLKDAGDGSTKLFEGLVTAANGAPKLEDGAQRLSDEGTKKLIAAGESTTSSYGEMVSVIEAGAERGSAEKMAYGAPDDAVGLTAYSYIVKGDDGESSRNLTRALSGLAVFGAAGGVFLLRRRMLI